MKTRITLLLVLLLVPASAAATPWTRAAGSYYVNVAYTRIAAANLYAPDFSSVELPGAYTQHTLSTYAQVGVIDRWLTVMFDATWLRSAALDEQGSTLGVGDMRLGVWSGLLVSPMRLSAGVIVGVPTGDPQPDAGENASRDDQFTAASLPTGDGEFDVELALSAGYSFGGRATAWPLQHYTIAQLGYWLRTAPRSLDLGNLPDAFKWRAELGTRFPWPVIERFWFIAKLYGTEAFASEDEISQSASGLGVVTHSSWSAEVYGRIWGGFGASVQISGAFRAAGLPAGAPLKFGLSYEGALPFGG